MDVPEAVDSVKALLPVKAQPLGDDEFEAWFAGRIPRRILSIPFGGPIPSAKSSIGVDLDGEWFSERTDIYGGHRALTQTRERLVDFHHSAQPPGKGYGDPTGMMTGRILGKSILDPDPDEDGWWSDFWWEKGNQRVSLIKRLVQKGAQLFGSSQPLGKTAKNDDGEITVWPHWLQTVSPSPQNTYAIIRPKASLEAIAGNPFWSDIEAALRSLGSDLRLSPGMGTDAAKSGRVLSAVNVSDLKSAIEAANKVLDVLRSVRITPTRERAGREPASE